ncbi:hypothetical protein OGAPHI_003402 [Ogataea philodendri]|uniref:Fcf2 pre-rRNA processing C-terminal domain-containing protein n=1 Tax=Ogataea philodendri TaxID=1378263 RepID=A0A9P8P7Z0_9ASCO|nr:uncharacterized protein OGAPHI_003402 [Ogataea philodendri]KAH3666952.1 hypothetical protein OGAPHI_003402 [Ogataea philodendri]
MSTFSPIPESVRSHESSGEEEETVLPGLDEIFSQLASAAGSRDPAQKKETFEDVKKAVAGLPKLASGELVAAKKERRVAKVDDPIDVAIPKSEKSAKSLTEQWFEMPKVELTEQLKRDLLVLKHRASIDPKRFYKKEKWEAPEKFHMGTIVGGPTDFHNRIHRKQRGTGFVDELLKNEETSGWLKKRYEEVQVKKGGRRPFKPKKRARR